MKKKGTKRPKKINVKRVIINILLTIIIIIIGLFSYKYFFILSIEDNYVKPLAIRLHGNREYSIKLKKEEKCLNKKKCRLYYFKVTDMKHEFETRVTYDNGKITVMENTQNEY